MASIRFLTDENVPFAVTEFLRSHGHEVMQVGENLAKGSPDELLLVTAELQGLVVMTFDKDFKSLIQQIPEGRRSSVARRAGRVSLRCREHEARSRIADLVEVIEFHYDFAGRRGSRFVMQISGTSVMIVG